MTLLAVFIALVFFYSLVSRRIERTIVTAPIVFTTAGMGCYLIMSEFQLQEGSQEVFLRLAEIGLVLLLFTDASRTDLRVLQNIRNLPARLLSTGMLLTLLLGALAALVVFRQFVPLGSRDSRRHPRADGRRARTDHREQSARADENPPGAQRGSRTQ